MRVPFKYFPKYMRQGYGLYDLVYKGYVYIKLKNGMYNLKQAIMIVYKEVHSLLHEQSYHPVLSSIGLWNHPVSKVLFNLFVDGF